MYSEGNNYFGCSLLAHVMKLNINVIAHSVQEDSSNPNELPGTKDEATRDAVNLLLASRRLLIVARALLCWLAFEL